MHYVDKWSFYKVQTITPAPPIEKELLPRDMWKEVFSKLGMQALGKASLVSRKWYRISTSDEVWARFKKRYHVESPNLKSKIGRVFGLEYIYNQINQVAITYPKWDFVPVKIDFFSKLVKLFFAGNIRKFQSDKCCDKFKLTLHKPRKICFNHHYIKNIYIRKTCCLEVDNVSGLYFPYLPDFRDHSIEINHSPLSFMNSNMCSLFDINNTHIILHFHNDIDYYGHKRRAKLVNDPHTFLSHVTSIEDG